MSLPPPEPALVDRFRADLAALAPDARGPFGLAISGGPDSLALLLLARAAFPGAVHAATVDHRLRPEAAAEAAFVAEVCAGLGVPHSVLVADRPPTGNVQSEARALRYRLLGRWAEAGGLGPILTAHHADDQAETLLMRLHRGAGLAGLSGIRAATEIEGAPILRPLLGWRRAALAAIPAAAGLVPVDDPGNRDAAYDRARLRARLAGADWLEPAGFVRSAAALAEAEAALDWAGRRLAEERVTRADGATLFDPQGLPAELRRRILLILLAAETPPRGADLQRLLATLDAGGTATLAGIRCSGGAVWRLAPAPPRRPR